MKRVIVVSYVFPPLHCGIGRIPKLVKYLPEFGWEPVVLTVRKSFFRPRYDYEALEILTDDYNPSFTLDLPTIIYGRDVTLDLYGKEFYLYEPNINN